MGLIMYSNVIDKKMGPYFEGRRVVGNMATSTRAQVLSLYRLLLKESKKFPSYNYRTYALRRVRDAFRENQGVEEPRAVERLLDQARDTLALIQRQVSIGRMYQSQKTVIEKQSSKKT